MQEQYRVPNEDLVTNKRNSISEAKLGKQLDDLVAFIEKHAAKLKKINGGTLESFQVTFGITGGSPILSASGGLTLSYRVVQTPCFLSPLIFLGPE